MALFGLFGNKNNNTDSTSTPTSTPVTNVGHNEVTLDMSKGVSLNLNKGDFLNLTKSDSTLSKVRLAAGWDANFGGSSIDLDLAAYLQDETGKVINTIYFGNKKGQGIYLDGDNLTGEGDGDDENIYVELNSLLSSVTKITFAVVIYSSHKFNNVKNAYVRLVNETTGKEMAKFNLSNDGGDHKSVKFAELFKSNGDWNFKAVGTYHNADIRNFKSIL